MDDWVELLPMAEFAYNNSQKTTTGYSPFYANYGYHPNTGLSQARTDILPVTSKVSGYWMKAIHKDCLTMLQESYERIKKFAARNRSEAPNYLKCDHIMLGSKNIRNLRPYKKLDHKLHGPFKITEIISE
jgi:hypothetical protein